MKRQTKSASMRLIAFFTTLILVLSMFGETALIAHAGVTTGSSGSINATGSKTGLNGGVRHADYSVFRVGVMRDPGFYNGGKATDTADILKSWSHRYPDNDESLFFTPNGQSSLYGNYEVGRYDSGSRKMLTYNDSVSKARVINLSTKPSTATNVGKNLLNGYSFNGTKKYTELSGGKWKTIANQITAAQANAAWSYILAPTSPGTYDIVNRMDTFISPHSSKYGGATPPTEAELEDIGRGYLGLLMTTWRLVPTALKGPWESAIEDYITQRLQAKGEQPVSIVVDTALTVSFHSTGKQLVMPTIDYFHYYTAVGSKWSLHNTTDAMIAGARGNTRSMLEAIVRGDINDTPSISRTSDSYDATNVLNFSASSITYPLKKMMTKNKNVIWVDVNSPLAILEQLKLGSPASGKNIYGFVAANFTLPLTPPTIDVNNTDPAKANIKFTATPDNKVIPPGAELIGEQVTLTFTGIPENSILNQWDKIFKDDTTKNKTVRVKITPNRTASPTAKVPASYSGDRGNYTVGVDVPQKDFIAFLSGKTAFKLTDNTASEPIKENETKIYTYKPKLEITYVLNGKNETFTLNLQDTASFKRPPNPPEYIGYTSNAKAYSELKHERPDNESFEAMAGVPSNKRLYLGVGGSEFIVDVELEYKQDVESVWRTYRSYFTGTPSEFKAGDTAPNMTLGEATVDLHNGGTYTKTWSGSVPWTGKVTYSDHTISVTNTWDHSAAEAAKAEADAYAALVNGTTLSFTSASDKKTRSYSSWGATVTGSASNGTAGWANAGQPELKGQCPDGVDSKGNTIYKECITQNYVASSGADGTAGSYSYTVTFTVPAHVIDGPECTYDLPGVEDNWKQKIKFDYMRISRAEVYKIEEGRITRVDNVFGEGNSELKATIKQGNPTFFYNIAQQNAGGNDAASQSSKHGRLRYSLEENQHDKVEWNEGTRTNKSAGMGANGSSYAPQGGGHSNSWATGILYNNPTASTEVDFHKNRGGTSTSISNRADAKDVATTEWKKFDQRRKSLNKATVISDMLILQTSSGDQSVLYFAKDSETKQSQEQFPDVKATKEEMWDNNPNSAYRWEKNHIYVGSYNGQYTLTGATASTNQKYWGYNQETKQTINNSSGGSRQQVATRFDSNAAGTDMSRPRPARPSKLYIYETRDIVPTTQNGAYMTGNSEVFYERVLSWRTPTPYEGYGNIPLRDEQYKAQVQPNFNSKRGIVLESPYSDDHSKVNDIVIHTPVSTENAMIVSLPKHLDQRTETPPGGAGAMIDEQNRLQNEENNKKQSEEIEPAIDKIITTTTLIKQTKETKVATETAPATTGTKSFAYKGSVEAFTAPTTGNYVIEVWGAQGGGNGGKGGYSKGTFKLNKGQVININVGGQNGHNGGGGTGTSAGGGATTAVLSDGTKLATGAGGGGGSGGTAGGSGTGAGGASVGAGAGTAGTNGGGGGRSPDHTQETGYWQSTGYWDSDGYWESTGYWQDTGYWKEVFAGYGSDECRAQGYVESCYEYEYVWVSTGSTWVSTGSYWVETSSWWVDTGERWVSTGSETIQGKPGQGGANFLATTATNKLNTNGVQIGNGKAVITYDIPAVIDENVASVQLPSSTTTNTSNLKTGDPNGYAGWTWEQLLGPTWRNYIQVKTTTTTETTTATNEVSYEADPPSTKPGGNNPSPPGGGDRVYEPVDPNDPIGQPVTPGDPEIEHMSVPGAVQVLNVSIASIPSNVVNFNYTGSSQPFTAHADGTYLLEVWGAQGGGTNGGRGGYSKGEVTLKAGEVLNVYVGGQSSGNEGGYNGGGYGNAKGGGGATDIRKGGITLYNRIIVAGAGGGEHSGAGGYGGGLEGGKPAFAQGTITGGTQTAGGSSGGALGVGASTSTWSGAGGGGGYYGGGSNTGLISNNGGAGGSGYIGGVSKGDMLAGNQTLPNPTGGTQTGHSGHGYARITQVDSTSTTTGASRVFEATGTGHSGTNTNRSTGNLGGEIQMSNSMYFWTVPHTGKYTIEAYGAEGGAGTAYTMSGGKGAKMVGDFDLTEGEKLLILVGQKGGEYSHGGGGGGGTFVAKGNSHTTTTPLIVAGGGGGSSASTGQGKDGLRDIGNGKGGNNTQTTYSGGGGGGFLTNGGSWNAVGGKSFEEKGQGGEPHYNATPGHGGFGGGGGNGYFGGGGGGGYQGGAGGSGDHYGGEGGLSYNIGSSQTNTSGVNTGHGKVIITAHKVVEPEPEPEPEPEESETTVIITIVTEVIVTVTEVATITTVDQVKVKADLNKFPDRMPDGTWNPIKLKFGQGSPDPDSILDTPITTPDGGLLHLATFINLDYPFQVYFPNRGSFSQQPNLKGIDGITTTRGMGYTNNMDTTQYTHAKKVRFMFNVIHKGTLYQAGTWINLSVNEEYFDFYAVLANEEQIASEVQYESIPINGRPLGEPVNENYKEETNKDRFADFSAYHGAFRKSYVDVVGRIGNFAVADTEDFRFSNLFKQSVASNDWVLEGIVKVVNMAKQNKYYGDLFDIRGVDVRHTGHNLNTYGTQTWLEKPPLAMPVNPKDNVNDPLRAQFIKPGYDVFAEVSTTGNYQEGVIRVLPYYYKLDIDTGTITPLDVYQKIGEEYKPVNLYTGADSGSLPPNLHPYSLILDWENESIRRNFTIDESIVTNRVALIYGEYIYGIVVPSDGGPTEEGITGVQRMTTPAGNFVSLGNSQRIIVDKGARTFIGTPQTYGDNKNPGNVLPEDEYNLSGQRWHFKMGLPSSSVFVEAGKEVNQANLDAIKNGTGVVLMTADVISVGEIYTLRWEQPGITSMTITKDGKTRTFSTKASGLPPVIALYDLDTTAVVDVDIQGSH